VHAIFCNNKIFDKLNLIYLLYNYVKKYIYISISIYIYIIINKILIYKVINIEIKYKFVINILTN